MDTRLHQHRLSHWLGRLFVVFCLVASCSTQAADEKVAPLTTPMYVNAVCENRFGLSPCQSTTPSVACGFYWTPWYSQGTILTNPPPVLNRIVWDGYPGLPKYYECRYNYYAGYGPQYYADTTIAVIKTTPNCPTATPPYTFNIDSGMCERPEQCPANSSGTFPDACRCNDGYEPDPTKTHCVPKCSISDLPPITDPEVQTYEDNPDLSDTENLDPQMRDVALPCLLRAAAAGSPSVGSAYRPPAYNQHLIDVWDKWVNKLKPNKEAACAARKTKIHNHFKDHKLLESQPPVPNSRHTRGLAVDVSIDLPSANIDALARGCGLNRPLPVDDPVHFQFP